MFISLILLLKIRLLDKLYNPTSLRLFLWKSNLLILGSTNIGDITDFENLPSI